MANHDLSRLRALLQTRNQTLASNLGAMRGALLAARVPALLIPYRDRLLRLCDERANLLTENQRYLSSPQDDILEEVLSNTKQAALLLRLLSERLAPPVLRACENDRLCLSVISWMHDVHPRTASIPAAHGDGSIGVWPLVTIVPIYFFPCLEQRGLLYLPLNFHELGHVLYALQKQEMDDLVRDLQQEVEAVLRPRSRRNDPHSRVQASRQRLVVNAWYSWAQEFFCDAIGLSIGGPAFLHSFSNYLSRLVKEDFYQPESDLRHGAHPVTWLRIKFLIRRAGAMGLLQDAQEVDEEWAAVAQALQAREEYHGFYDDALEGAVERTISDMLTEADPRPFRADEAEAGRDWQPGDSPILLLNRAWRAFISDPQNYARWEADAVQRFLTSLG